MSSNHIRLTIGVLSVLLVSAVTGRFIASNWNSKDQDQPIETNTTVAEPVVESTAQAPPSELPRKKQETKTQDNFVHVDDLLLAGASEDALNQILRFENSDPSVIGAMKKSGEACWIAPNCKLQLIQRTDWSSQVRVLSPPEHFWFNKDAYVLTRHLKDGLEPEFPN